MPKPFPVRNGVTSFWRTEPHSLDSHRSSESIPEQSDIVVIGAGYAGASVVHHILEQIPFTSQPPSIVILEARQACSGATGRNGGHMKPDLYNGISGIAAEHGVEAAAEVAAFEARHVHSIKDFVEKEKIACDYTVTKAVDVQLDQGYSDKLKDGYDRLVASGLEPTKQAQYIDGGNAQKFSGVKGAVGCFTYDAGHVWPYKFVLHLLEKAISRGVNLQTHTAVSGVSRSTSSTSSHHWQVNTSRGAIVAKVVVLATNAYTSALAPQYQEKIIPVRGTCSRIIVPPGPMRPRLEKTYTLRRNGWDYDYLIPRADGSIIVGGARPPIINQLESWYNVSDDSVVLQRAAQYFDGYMQRNFVGWEDSHAYTDRVWTGIMGYSSDGFPHIGRVPGHDGQFILAGFTGHGMPQIFLAAEGLAKMIVAGTEFMDTGLPRLFQTTQARLDSSRNQALENVPTLGSLQARP
ncbi:FAD dependent oxidoreductase [Penicillium alfredii]|uniref:FAD dependent oxidoreductase n=1 Tax=Penicillium alfredii TaxID=1506179 RepID=A0A9W9EHF0_9EURO|nr:FAD dependent oxidoreductase [Penicillium alfredii]KAJ5081859.1 FAD dependent oxidoreductase [Penicillium alfredii]